jgi:basic membrane lipoprotein Med (substrate-binding protein (PBP1-ABC) superfamily)
MHSFQGSGTRFSTPLHTACVGLLLVALPWTSACRSEPARESGDGRRAAGSRRADSAFRVALLTPGPISDQSWNAGAYQGLLRIRDSLGAQISHIQTKTPAEFEENFRQYGAQRYALVFGHGFEFQDAAQRVAPDYPATQFVVTSGNTSAPNVSGMVFGFEDASYLAGLIAGSLTKSHVVGVIGGTELPPVKSSFEAFAAGARAADPRVRVLTSYIGNWDDVSAGKEQALAQIARGVDVIFQNADAAGLGVFQAARERKNVYVFGSNSNQNAVAPAVTLGSVVIDLPHAFLSVARAVRAGRYVGHVLHLGTAEDVVKLVVNPALADQIPARTRSTVDSLQRLMAAGTYHAPQPAGAAGED